MSDESSPSPRREAPALTPLGTRLVLALRHVASQYDELQIIVRGFEKHMRKHPFKDEEIRGGLEAIRAHIDIILDDGPRVVDVDGAPEVTHA